MPPLADLIGTRRVHAAEGQPDTAHQSSVAWQLAASTRCVPRSRSTSPPRPSRRNAWSTDLPHDAHLEAHGENGQPDGGVSPMRRSIISITEGISHAGFHVGLVPGD
jgi:hypothetical protein